MCDSRNRGTVILKRKNWRGCTLLFNFKRKCIIHVCAFSFMLFLLFLFIHFFISLRGDQKNVITFFHFLKSICCHDPSRPTFLLSNCHILRGKSYHLFSPLLRLFVYFFFICSISHFHRNWIGKAPRRSWSPDSSQCHRAKCSQRVKSLASECKRRVRSPFPGGLPRGRGDRLSLLFAVDIHLGGKSIEWILSWGFLFFLSLLWRLWTRFIGWRVSDSR